jgi:hypothetical protein
MSQEAFISQDTRNALVLGTVGAVVLTGGFFGVRHLIRQARQDNASKDSVIQGNPAETARAIRMAFENDNVPGTNEDSIYAALQRMPNQRFYAQVYTEYKKLYSGSTWSNFYHGLSNDLNSDMESELSLTEFSKAKQIINSLPR